MARGMTLRPSGQAHAARLVRLRKPPAAARETMTRMARGLPVTLGAATQALFYTAIAAATAGGESPTRRQDTEAARAIWEEIHGALPEGTTHPTFGVEWEDPASVAAWLLEE